MHTEFYWRNSRAQDHLEALGVDWKKKKILKRVFKGSLWIRGLDLYGSGQGHVAGSCEYGDELPCSIKFKEFVDQLRNYQILTEDSVPWS